METELLNVELSEFNAAPHHPLLDVPSRLLSQIADQMMDRQTKPRILDLIFATEDGARIAGRNLGEELERGVIRVRFNKTIREKARDATLGGVTASGMSGGLLWIEGNVERVCDVHGGVIFVRGDVHELINVHNPAVVICTGEAGPHLYRGDKSPSEYIRCASAPLNSVSHAPDGWKSHIDPSTGVSLVQMKEDPHIEANVLNFLTSIQTLLSAELVPTELIEALLNRLGIPE